MTEEEVRRECRRRRRCQTGEEEGDRVAQGKKKAQRKLTITTSTVLLYHYITLHWTFDLAKSVVVSS